MKTRDLFTSTALIIFVLATSSAARAQEQEAPKVELGVQFTSLSINLPVFGGTQNPPGFGARVTYNLNDFFAVEAEGNLYPETVRGDYVVGGAAQQAQFGAKVGRRWKRVGLFAKARPGFVSFGETLAPFQTGSGAALSTGIVRERKTHFALDVGGVLEFYASRRTFVRVDAGDTVIRYGEHDEVLNPIAIVPHDQRPVGRAPSETTHNFQFTAGVGFRFGGGEGGGAAPSSTSASARGRRFEAGVQFSSLALRPPRSDSGSRFFGPTDEGSGAEAGFGGRLGYNVTDSFAVEAEGNFYPRRSLNFGGAFGGYPSQMQFGAKVGRRYERFGVFAKARPGFVSFSAVPFITATETDTFGGQQFVSVIGIGRERRTYFSMDVGGAFEFYHSRRWLTRLDLGDTMIRYGDTQSLDFLPVGADRTVPGGLRHNLQFTAGLGLRF